MATMSDDPEVVDERSASRFAVVIDGHAAELVYGRKGDHLTLVHTGVPEELGGRGLGGKLVRKAVDVAEADGLTLVPQCEFARGWLEGHPDVASRVNIEWPPQ
jgi:predicted GNAT family acetyltransferase